MDVTVGNGWAWLMNRQDSSGSWGSTYRFVDTCTAIQSLRVYNPQAPQINTGAAWLASQSAGNYEYLARQAITLAPLPGYAVMAGGLVNQLLLARNAGQTDNTRPNWPEGGWGLSGGYATDCMTTAVALQALKAAGLVGGVAAQNRSLAGNGANTHEFDLPADAFSVHIYIVPTKAVRVQIKAGAAPVATDPYVSVAANAAQDILVPGSGLSLAAGHNYLTVRNTVSASATYTLHVSYQAPNWDTRTIWDPYNTSAQGYGPLEYLVRSQNADGGWGLQRGSPSEFYTSLHVLLALQEYAQYDLAAVRAAGISYVKSQQLTGGAFGYDGTAVPYVTALAALALTRSETYPFSTAVQNALAALRAMQGADGSWSDEPYDTALALQAIWEHNQAPTVGAGPDQWVIDIDGDGMENVSLTATAADVDGTIQSYVWSEAGQPLAIGPSATVSLPLGKHTIQLAVTDDASRTVTDTLLVIVSAPIRPFYQQNLDLNPNWTTEGSWLWGKPAGKGGDHGGADPTTGYTGMNVYGYNLSGGYQNYMAPKCLTTRAINCSTCIGVHLRFRRWLCIEESKYDHASIQVSNDGSRWITIWDFSGATLVETAWSLQDYDISALADGKAAVYIRWVMGPTDQGFTWGGWNIDDVELTGASLVAGTPASVIYRNDLDADPGWTTTGKWAFGVPTGAGGDHGGADPRAGYTGMNVYGYNLAGGYDNNMTPQYLATPAIDCSTYKNVHLLFRRWLCIETSQYDHASIQASTDGSSWTTVWDFSGATLVETSWSLQDVDISSVADNQAAVYIRWVMGPTDVGYTWGGWNIDDVLVTGTYYIPPVITTFYQQPMDADPGWTTEGAWTWGVPTGAGGDHGGADPAAGYTGSYVYGYNLSGGYENNMTPKYLTTPAIDCTGYGDVHLRFRRWLCLEESLYDHASVQVSTDGLTWTTVWDFSGPTLIETAWSRQNLDISAVADNRSTVYIRWAMGPTDVGWTWGGWNIDDVELTGGVYVPKTAFYQQNMNADPGWSAEGAWAWGRPTGGGGDHGGADPTAGYTGSNVYGYNLNGGYENNMTPKYLTTTAINCTGYTQVQLRFRRWLCVEESIYDHASVQISSNQVEWLTLWDFSGPTLVETAWSFQDFDISSVADNQPTVYVRWGMGPTDVGWTWGGWNIDDVELLGRPVSVP